MGLARHEAEFEAASEAALDVRELLEALGGADSQTVANRSQTIANCLSGGAGWRDAATRLGGAFAPPIEATGLTSGKE
ncbi:MAG: hypothetical protein ABIN83_01685 [Sphingomicrobium sp.]